MDTITQLPPGLHALAAKHFVLLSSENRAKKRDSLQLNLSGYSDVMFLIADLVKVCILALEAGPHEGNSHIPEPTVNISAVLGIILDLVPYEEADLLDRIREAVLDPQPEVEEGEDDFLIENYFLRGRKSWMEEN